MKKVLLIEDDRFSRSILETTLKNECELILLEEGSNAIDSIASQQPDLVLLDLILPGKDGFDILKELKEKEETKNIPIIVISNLGQDEEIERAKELGAEDYFIKANTDIHELANVVKNFFDAN